MPRAVGPPLRPIALVLSLVLGAVVPARAQGPACGPVPLDSGLPHAERTEILVLGSQHLRRIESFDPSTLDPLLAALEAWGPDAIGVETLPPREIAAMEREPAFAPVLDAFAGEEVAAARLARERLGQEWPAAAAAADSLLAAVEASPEPDPALRRDLILHLVAAYRLDDAALHAASLSRADREAIPDSLRAIVERRLDEANETSAIGIALARRLGLSRVHPIDDHLDKDLFLAIAEALTGELETSAAYREVVESAALEVSTESLRAAHDAGDLLPFYLEQNERAALEADVDLEWRLFFRTRLPSGLDRYRVALWEVRNLAMAGHIRRMSAPFPGGRVLVVVGASHKPFLEAALACGMDVEVVQLADLVRER